MSERIRYYHPDSPPSWWDRLYDGFAIADVPARREGIDYAFFDRMLARCLRGLIDGVDAIELLGRDVVVVETWLRLPEAADARRELCGELTARLRFGQVGPDGRRVNAPVRWVEFRPTPDPDRTRLLLRVSGRLDPSLRSYLAANLGDPAAGHGLGIAGE